MFKWFINVKSLKDLKKELKKKLHRKFLYSYITDKNQLVTSKFFINLFRYFKIEKRRFVFEKDISKYVNINLYKLKKLMSFEKGSASLTKYFKLCRNLEVEFGRAKRYNLVKRFLVNCTSQDAKIVTEFLCKKIKIKKGWIKIIKEAENE